MTDLTFIEIGIFLGSIIISLSFHEAMHGFMAFWLGDDTANEQGRLTLNPIKHIDPFTTVLLPLTLLILNYPPFLIAKPVPFNPYRVKWGDYGAALVGVVGPLSNLLLAFVGVGMLKIFDPSFGSLLKSTLELFVQLNIAIFVFNMIPFPPLDGSRLLYAFAPDPLRALMKQIESFGLMGIFLFMFLLFPIIVPIVSFVNNALIQLFLG